MKNMQKRRNKWVRDRRRKRKRKTADRNKHRTHRVNNNKPKFIYSFAWPLHVCVAGCVTVWMIGQSSTKYRDCTAAHFVIVASVCLRAPLCALLVYNFDRKITVWFHRCLNGSKIKSYDLILLFFFSFCSSFFNVDCCCWQSTWQSDNGYQVRSRCCACVRSAACVKLYCNERLCV